MNLDKIANYNFYIHLVFLILEPKLLEPFPVTVNSSFVAHSDNFTI